MKLKSFSLSLILFSFLITSCSDSDRDDDSTTNASTANALAESLMNEVWKDVHSIILTDTVMNPQDTTEPREVCIDSIKGIPDFPIYPLDITIYYGSGNTPCDDGRLRNGNLKVNLTQPYVDSSSVLTIEFDNYTLDEFRLTGTYVVTNMGFEEGLPKFRKQVTNGQIWKDGVGNAEVNILYDADQTAIWGIGALTDTLPFDDQLRISGFTAGRTSRGKFFTTEITNPLISSTDCNWESAGDFTVKLTSIADRKVNVGDGTCDNMIRVQINNSFQEVAY